MFTWGLVSMAMAFAQGTWSFYGLRFLLGVAEAGFFPGVMLYLTYWFPQSQRAEIQFLVFSSPFRFRARLGLRSPVISLALKASRACTAGSGCLFSKAYRLACLLSQCCCFLPDKPAHAKFLSEDEKQFVAKELSREAVPHADLWAGLGDPRVWILAVTDIGIIIALSTVWVSGWPQIVNAMGFTHLQTGFVVALPYIASSIGMIVWARSSDTLGERSWHVAAPVLFASASLVVAAVLGTNLFAVLALTCASVGIYAALVIYWTLPPMLPRRRGGGERHRLHQFGRKSRRLLGGPH